MYKLNTSVHAAVAERKAALAMAHAINHAEKLGNMDAAANDAAKQAVAEFKAAHQHTNKVAQAAIKPAPTKAYYLAQGVGILARMTGVVMLMGFAGGMLFAAAS